MGFRSPKPLVMFRPRGDMAVQKRPPTAATSPDGSPAAFPIRVADRMDVGYMIKYRLQFDDGAVRVGLTNQSPLPICVSAHCGASCQRVERVKYTHCCALLQPPYYVQQHPHRLVVRHRLRLLLPMNHDTRNMT